MSDLVSKVLAGGLSAGLFLFWWPAHFTAQGGEWLVIRGLVWSLVFEIMLLSFRPLEQAIGGALRGRRPGALAPRRLARRLTLAAIGVAVPLAMLSGARAPIAGPARAAAPKVIVKRQVVRREVVVRRVNHIVHVPAPAAAPAPAPATTAARPAIGRTATRAARRAATTKTATNSQVVDTSAPSAGTKATTPSGATVPAMTTTAPAAATPATTPPAASATAETAAAAPAIR